MISKNIKYIIFIFLVLAQGILLYFLFLESLIIDGDINTYLKIIGGDINIEFDIEPLSFLIFKVIGFFPVDLHFFILYFSIFLMCVIESWIIFKAIKGSLLWIFFFSLAIVPFFHAINLRTGFGMFFLFLFFKYKWSLFLSPFFHASFFPLLAGFKFKISVKTIVFLLTFSILLILLLFSLISGKLSNYLGYYTENESVIGIFIEISLLVVFFFLLKKNYQLKSNILWYRILFLVLFIAFISLRVAIISSRFITLAYLIILIVRMNSIKIEKIEKGYLSNFVFFFFFFVLLLFRVYRISTMFGFYQN
jgi:hypothetical protein